MTDAIAPVARLKVRDQTSWAGSPCSTVSTSTSVPAR